MQVCKTDKVFVCLKICIPKCKPMHKKVGCYKPPPLKMNLVLEIRWLRTEEWGGSPFGADPLVPKWLPPRSD
jgi:hypothetical protein